MDQRVRFLKVLIKYTVTFYIDVNLSVQNHLEQSCVIVIRCSRHRDLKALGVFDLRSYVASVFVLCPDIICNYLDCSNVFVGLPDVAVVKDITFYIRRVPFKIMCYGSTLLILYLSCSRSIRTISSSTTTVTFACASTASSSI